MMPYANAIERLGGLERTHGVRSRCVAWLQFDAGHTDSGGDDLMSVGYHDTLY